MWNLYENEKELNPLNFSNGKSQSDIVKEVIDAINSGNKLIFIRGMCGTGKSAIALNLARKIGKTSIVVPIKSLQEQYTKDYAGSKYVLKDGKKLSILSVFGRKNFMCRYLKENTIDFKRKQLQERNLSLTEVFATSKNSFKQSDDDPTCDNKFLPCKIEIKEKNLNIIKDYLKQNPSIKTTDFDSITDVKRMSIASVCPYWSPILPEELDIKKFKNDKKIKYIGLNNRTFILHQRESGCPYYEQYSAYNTADVIIFNSAKYIIETVLNRKPYTDLEIIDECDDFLDSFSNQEQVNLNRLLFSLNSIVPEDYESKKVIKELIAITNNLKESKGFEEGYSDIAPLVNSLAYDLLTKTLDNSKVIDILETEESSYLNHLYEIGLIFRESFNETHYSLEKREKDIILHLVTTDLSQRIKEIIEKNRVVVMMSGTIHSENVLKNIFGLNNFKIVEAETSHQGRLLKQYTGLEMDCSYQSFKSGISTRDKYLSALSKSVSIAKRPTLVHVNSFSDLPTEYEKTQLHLDNLISQEQLLTEQNNDPLGKRVNSFKEKRTDILFTTRCNRGVDFPGDTCNSIIVTRFPYPNISSLFWKILKKNKPSYFMSFYIDKSKRELLQKVYRGLRSKNDTVFLLSPDSRVLDFDFI